MITFPTSPTLNQEFPLSGPKRWKWNGTTWDLMTISDTQVALAQAAAASAAASAATIGTTAAFSDVNPIAKNSTDNTKQLKVNLAALAASQVVTWTVRALSGTVAFLSDLTEFILPNTYYDSGATNALNLANGGYQRWAPATGAQTLTITGWPTAGKRGDLQIEGVNLAAANISWPTACRFQKPDRTWTSNFTDSAIALLSSGVDTVYMWTRDAGATIYVKVVS